MFLKQYNYKPRSNSVSSSSSASGSATKEESKTTANTSEASAPAASAAAAGRRRSSASDKFAGLQGQKRNSQDERKTSWAEQKPGRSGILGGMWNNFTKGS